jgi:hypothetical protein
LVDLVVQVIDLVLVKCQKLLHPKDKVLDDESVLTT